MTLETGGLHTIPFTIRLFLNLPAVHFFFFSFRLHNQLNSSDHTGISFDLWHHVSHRLRLCRLWRNDRCCRRQDMHVPSRKDEKIHDCDFFLTFFVFTFTDFIAFNLLLVTFSLSLALLPYWCIKAIRNVQKITWLKIFLFNIFRIFLLEKFHRCQAFHVVLGGGCRLFLLRSCICHSGRSRFGAN